MRLVIAGSRGITDYEVLRTAVVASGYWKQHKESLEIVSGMARGVDSLAVEFARRNGLVLWEFPADWQTHGKAAGHIRNRQMAEFCDCVLVIWDGESPGTKNMIKEAQRLHKPVFIWRDE